MAESPATVATHSSETLGWTLIIPIIVSPSVKTRGIGAVAESSSSKEPLIFMRESFSKPVVATEIITRMLKAITIRFEFLL